MAESGNVVQMDQDMAQVLFREGAILAFLDVPEGTEFGIDYNCWRAGQKFKGVKMIPPGIHFVYYSATNKERQAAPRTGFFYDFRPREMLIKKWDKYNEDISSVPVTSDDQERFEQSREELDRYLGAYPYDSYKKWISLTNQVTPKLLGELQPLSGSICSVTELQSPGSNTQQRRAARAQREAARAHNEATQTQNETLKDATKSETRVTNSAADASKMETDHRQVSSQEKSQLDQSGDNLQLDKDGLPELTVVPGSEIRFSKIPEQKWPDGATPAEVTKYSMDHSYVLENLLNSDAYRGNNLAILGEIQFAFICFLIGQVYDAFEQWKHLVHLLCHCDDALANHSALYDQFITTMHFQVREIPEDFFVDIISRNNFLTSTLQVFFSNLDNLESDMEEIKNLKKKGENFRKHLEKKFQWDFTTEDDEFAPVVVDL